MRPKRILYAFDRGLERTCILYRRTFLGSGGETGDASHTLKYTPAAFCINFILRLNLSVTSKNVNILQIVYDKQLIFFGLINKN